MVGQVHPESYPAIEVRELRKVYGDKAAVDGLMARIKTAIDEKATTREE